jgi:flagellar hook-associated protein 2
MNPLAGLGSNLDVNSLVAGLMEVERAPLRAISAKNAQYQANLSAFGTAKGALSGLQTASRALADAMTSIPATVTTSTPAVASATAAAGTTPANFSLSVQTLAQAHRVYTGAFATADTVVGGGAIAIDRGSFDGTAFTANTAIPALTITIAANATLNGIRDAINNAGAGITASVVNDGSGFRLVLGADDTGAAQGMRIRTTDDDGNNTDTSGLSQLAFDPEATVGAGRNMTQARAGSDAAFTVDGLPMTRASNDVADAVGGVTFKLTGAGDTTVGVSRDLSKMRSALDELVKAYNSTSGTLKSQSSYDAASRSGGPLNGESSIRSVQAQMRRVITTSFGADGDTYRTLSALGVSVKSGGTLTVDTAKYEAAMGADPAAASAMIGEFARSLSGTLDSALGSGGAITARTDGIQTAMQRLTDQQTRVEARLSAVEARYRAQFSALDGLMSRMTATNSFLTSQLASINGNSGR